MLPEAFKDVPDTVEIRSYKTDGTVIKQASDANSVVVSTGTSGFFTANVVLDSTGGFLVSGMEKPPDSTNSVWVQLDELGDGLGVGGGLDHKNDRHMAPAGNGLSEMSALAS